MTDAGAREVDFGSSQRTAKSAHAVVAADLSPGGIPLTYRVQILEPTVLDSYLRRRVISPREHEAGATLASIFTRAIHLPAVTAAYGECRGGGGGADTGIDGRKRLYAVLIKAGLAVRLQHEQPLVIELRDRVEREPIMGAIGLTNTGHIAISVCGYNEWAGGTRRIAGLRKALGALADLWEIPKGASVEQEKAKIRKWRASDAKGSNAPEARDMSWSDRQNDNRRARVAKAQSDLQTSAK